MNGNDQFFGIVLNGQFQLLDPQRVSGVLIRLTAIQMNESIPPESAELNLTEFEGKAIMAQGYDSGGWIYSATAIDSAGPLLTALVQKVFERTRDDN